MFSNHILYAYLLSQVSLKKTFLYIYERGYLVTYLINIEFQFHATAATTYLFA